MAVWVADSFFFGWSDSFSSAIPLWVRITASVLILGVAAYLFVSVVRMHGSEFESGGLITSGMFSRIRHPMYLAVVLFYLALTVATGSLAALATLPIILIYYDRLARREEDELLRRYPDEYSVYMTRTGRWLPGR
jgi:protein-S-isoprenylcysteine O-methyltransferase Ste14